MRIRTPRLLSGGSSLWTLDTACAPCTIGGMKRIVFLADQDFVSVLEEYRAARRPIPTLAETIRHLVTIGVDAERKRQEKES